MCQTIRPSLSILVVGLGVATALSGLAGCAYSATTSLPRPTLIFEATVEGPQLIQANNLAYYFIIDADGKPETGPLVNGPTPITNPYPDPRSYLPFVRDEDAQLDREPVAVPKTYWNDYFWLTEDAGTMTMWQARRNADGSGTINERYRQLQSGREWGIKNGNTIQLTVPLSFLSLPEGVNTLPPQIECNLAVGTRALDNQARGYVIERWGRVQNTFFTLKTTPINSNIYDTVPGVTFPANVPSGFDQAGMNFTAITYRVTLSQ